MSECCLTMDSMSIGLCPTFAMTKCSEEMGLTSSCDVRELSSSSPSPPSPSASSISSCPSSSSSSSSSVRGSLKRPKAIGLQRFNFSLVNDELSTKQPHHHHHHHQLLSWQSNQSTSDKTFERTSGQFGSSSWSTAISASLPCLPVSSTSGQPTNILPFLYLGSQLDALSEEVIKSNGITHILNVSTTSPRSPFVPEVNFLRIPVNDSHTDRLLPYFQKAFQFLDEVRICNGCALVHCLAGISRSPTLVIAYIMRSLAMTTDEAYSFVKEKRATISPNFNFLGQLVEFESLCRQKPSLESSTKRLVRSTEDLRHTQDPAQHTPSSRHRLPKIIENEPSPLNQNFIQDAFDRGDRKLQFPCDWESQFSQSSMDSLDQLCFTPCFALVPTEDNVETTPGELGESGRVAQLHVEQSDARSKSARPRRHGAKPRTSNNSAVQFGLSSIRSSLKSSLRSSFFKRAEHHNKPVLLMD